MADKKTEERDWSEIMGEVRGKAQSEIEELVSELKPRVKELVEKVRKANFHDEAEEFLTKLRAMVNEFSTSEDGPPTSKPKAKAGTREALNRYLDNDGNLYKRPPLSDVSTCG